MSDIQPRVVASVPPKEPEPGEEYGPGQVVLQRQITDLRERVERLEATLRGAPPLGR